jgi:UDP-N-acetylglucosamine 2-epimerase (hydrolysing)
MEAPYYGLPAINIGNRQNNRSENVDLIHASYNKEVMLNSIKQAIKLDLVPIELFGEGKSSEKFMEVLLTDKFWNISKQKLFNDIN